MNELRKEKMNEPKSVADILKPDQGTLTAREILESYNDVELTDEETTLAIIDAKRRKKAEVEADAVRRIEADNRRRLTETQWSYDQTESFMRYRAEQLFKKGVFTKPFSIDADNDFYFKLLCYYFSNDPKFVSMGESAGLSGLSLSKGILTPGLYGVGKTWMMKLFQRNQRQTFLIRNAKEISSEFLSSKDKMIPVEYLTPYKNAVNDLDRFYQPVSGLCIDDMGTEEVKNNFGNKSNVIGDIIELRYKDGFTGTLLHANTNLSVPELERFYGGRVLSRMKEIFNFIELPGSDRRK